MADQVSDALQRQAAMSRWDDEGGAGPEGPQSEPNPHADQPSFPKMDDAEMQALHVRVIALMRTRDVICWKVARDRPPAYSIRVRFRADSPHGDVG